jgi:hypothetical protein
MSREGSSRPKVVTTSRLELKNIATACSVRNGRTYGSKRGHQVRTLKTNKSEARHTSEESAILLECVCKGRVYKPSLAVERVSAIFQLSPSLISAYPPPLERHRHAVHSARSQTQTLHFQSRFCCGLRLHQRLQS